MKVLFSGASSFSGYWFAHTLASKGHEVTITCTRDAGDYQELRGRRLDRLKSCNTVWSTSFGDDRFLALINAKRFDVICAHGAYVRDYRSEDFPVDVALASNTHRLPIVLKNAKDRGVKKVVLTGSVFEADEGLGENPLRAFSPYGLSKTLTAQAFRFWCDRLSVPLAKFVIPNPFGPYEEQRFTHYLMSTWANGKVAGVKTPAYVRDNIHISLLALAYADFVARTPFGAFEKLGPSGYVESQGAFAARFAREMQARTKLVCGLDLSTQTEFSEPITRINPDRPNSAALGWDESAAWDELASYYGSILGFQSPT
ncbi:MAG TPA: NAD(P)-dependent oxidoreductase [Steroidobacteraceae bacterium]|nr:NAD(P)-dependent oxidoreductase [Steroidobacteraceae bacterium]